MSTLTIPTNFADFTIYPGGYAPKLDNNFVAIRDYLNGTSGGIDGTNLATTGWVTPEMLAEHRSVSYLHLCFAPLSTDPTDADPDKPNLSVIATKYGTSFILREPAEVLGIRVGFVKSDALSHKVSFRVKSTVKDSGIPASVSDLLSFDDGQQSSWGEIHPPPNLKGKLLPAGSVLGLYLIQITSIGGIVMMMGQVKLGINHVNR